MLTDAKELTLQHLSNGDARSKLAAVTGDFIRDRLREASFTEMIIPAETVTRNDCQVSENHDSMSKMVWLEPQSKAMVVSFRSEPTAKLLRAERMLVPFITIMSEMYQKPEQEFLAYPFPLGKVVEQNSIKDMGEMQDRVFCVYSEAAVQSQQTEANGGVVTSLNASALRSGSPPVEFSVIKGELARAALTDDGIVRPLMRPDLVNLFKLLEGNRLECEKILISTKDLTDVLQWTIEDVGSAMMGDTTINGFKGSMLLGKKVIRTIKTDILRPGNVYAYTSPEFLGRFYILNNVKFYIDKVVNMIKFVAWKDIGMAIVNVASVRKLELYSGDATTNDADSIQASVTPKSESELGAPNNRVAERVFFPQTSYF